MAIPARQIGQPSSTKAQLLWNISKQLENLTKVAGNVIITPQITGGWSVVTGGEAGDGTVAQYSPTGFNITGPDDNQNNGWVYIKKYFPDGASLSIDYQWASADDGTNVDWPIYCVDDVEPTGQPSDLSVRADGTPQQSTWEIVLSPGQWFSVGIYSDDTCCGRGFLSIDVIENIATGWTFVPNEISVFPSNSDGYTLYTDGFTNNDDGNANVNVPFAGTFYANNIADTEYNLSTNGFIIPFNSGFNLKGNNQDLFLTPNASLSDGDTQNFWYQNYAGTSRWRTNILVYCGHCCDAASQETPYSYVLNVYRDNQYQYIEACNKQNNEVVGDAGVDGYLQSAYSATQVWQSDLTGTNWSYLGFGSITDVYSPPIILTYSLGDFGSMTYPAVTIYCDGGQVAYRYVNNYGPYTTIDQIVADLNTNNTNLFGTFSNVGNGDIQLIIPASVKNSLCYTGAITFSVQPD